MAELSKWTKDDAVRWLSEHPDEKTLIETLERDGILEKMEMLFYKENFDILAVAEIAGYKTGR